MTTLSAQWFEGQRWFAGKGSGAAEPGPAVTTTIDGSLAVTIAPVGDDHYQLVSIDQRPDSVEDPATGAALGRAFVAELSANGPAGKVRFHSSPATGDPGDRARALTSEQSNSSVVLGDRLILKVLRRLQPGPHPEVEMLGVLAERGCDAVPALAGWYEVTDGPIDATLGVLQQFVGDGVDGWRLVLDLLAGDRSPTMGLLHRLGGSLAGIHALLGAPDGPGDHGRAAAFAPEPGGPALAVRVAEGITDAVTRLSEAVDRRPADDPQWPALASDLDAAAALAPRLAAGLDTGPVIRHHGDLHLGQTLHTPRGWMIIDWEGEPARSLADRRAKHSPLRDVAGMLRSFSYAAATHARSHGQEPLGWLAAARAAFLDGYLAAADPTLLPPTAVATARVLALLELEKVVYELGYELANRPDWLAIPAGGLRSLLEGEPR